MFSEMKSELLRMFGCVAFAATMGLDLGVAAAAEPYPVPDGLPRFDRLTARVEGRELPVGVARCSKVPFNRRWPGHQRPLEQTEICGVAAFTMSGPATVELKVNEPFTRVVVRPTSKGVKATWKDGVIRLAVERPGQYSVEIDGWHRNLFLFADPPKDYGVDRNDPKVRWFGPGEHDAGVIEMKGGETLYLEAGAVVYGRIHARDADDIRILGRGILDASKVKEQVIRNDPAKDEDERKKGFAVANVKRFDAIRLEFCDRVRVDGVTIRDSLIYHFRPIGCRDVTVENVKVIGSWRYNADGLDMHNCERVVIRDSFVRTYDDAICVKGFDCWMDESEMWHDGYRHDVFRDVLVTNCVTWCDWGKCFEIGAETRAREICNITFRDCDAIRTSSAACDVYNVDWADVHDIVYENIRVEYDDERPAPLYQSSDDMEYADRANGRHQGTLLASAVQYHPEYSSGGTRRGRNRRILFKDIRVTGEALPPSYFVGCDADHRNSDITVDGIYLNGRRVESEKDAKLGYGKFADPVRFIGK